MYDMPLEIFIAIFNEFNESCMCAGKYANKWKLNYKKDDAKWKSKVRHTVEFRNESIDNTVWTTYSFFPQLTAEFTLLRRA